MPLARYGVAIGTLVAFTRDPQHRFGSWYHGHVTLDAGGTRWESALDVDAPSSVGVAYRLVTDLALADLGPVGTFAAGWHELASTPASGALDYVRSPRLIDGWALTRRGRSGGTTTGSGRTAASPASGPTAASSCGRCASTPSAFRRTLRAIRSDRSSTARAVGDAPCDPRRVALAYDRAVPQAAERERPCTVGLAASPRCSSSC